MDTDAKGQLGGMDAGEAVRRKMARESREWKCGACGRVNAEVMREQEEAAAGEEGRKEDEVPEQLRLAFREDLGKGKVEEKAEGNGGAVVEGTGAVNAAVAAPIVPQTPVPAATTTIPAAAAQVQQRRAPVAHQEDIPAWIDKAIIGVVFAIIAILWLRFFG
jgi:ubiquitin-conjugating enzyme E2 J1